jgi:tetratricopeptide (TPR) repeat protein
MSRGKWQIGVIRNQGEHAVEWRQIQEKLETVVRRIRQNKVLDAATVGLLNEIPVVGGFLSRYWDNLAANDQSPEAMAEFIESIAEQERNFDNLRHLIEKHGEQLIKQDRKLGDILVNVYEIGDDTRVIKTQIARMVETFEIPSARAAFEQAAAIGQDHRQSLDRIRQAEKVLEGAGAEADATSYYQLGLIYLRMSDFDDAEASLLEAINKQPDLVDALIGLAMIYQRRATEHLGSENYGLAESAAKRSEDYVKNAMFYEPTDMGLQVHLGYLYKDLAQRYAGTARLPKAQEMASKAWGCFERALKINPQDASAHNGLGSVCLIRRDYDGAIEHCSKAVELKPDYLFAYFDLAQACYLKARSAQDERTRLDATLRGLETCQKVFVLDQAPDHDSLPYHARQAIDQICQQLMAAANTP